MARESDTERPKLDRRTYLKFAGTAVAAGGGAVLTTRQGAAQASQVNVVEEGADDSGTRPVDAVLDRVAGPGVEVYFPPGTYLLNSLQLGYDDLTLRGEDATLVATSRSSPSTFVNLSGNRWEVDGFTIDYTRTSEAPRGQLAGRDWKFRNVTFEGVQYSSSRYGAALRPRVPSGSHGLIENVDLWDGAAKPGEASNRKAIWFGQGGSGYTVAGDITIRGCRFRHWAENTIYGHKAGGHVLIEDCVFEDTNVAGARVGGDTTIRNCVFRQVGPSPRQAWSGGLTQRGIWVSTVDGEELLIEGCEFVMSASTASSAILLRDPVPEITIRDCRIVQDVNRPAIEVSNGGPGVTIEDVSITGKATAPGVRLNGRSGSHLRNLCIQKPGTGVALNNSTGCAIESSTINVEGEALSLSGSSLTTREFSRSGSCPLPTDEGSEGVDEEGDDSLDRTIRIEGGLSRHRTYYEFSVSGDLEKAEIDGASINDSDAIDGSTAEGFVAGGSDAYHFSGELTEIDLDGPAEVYLDGERVAEEDLPFAQQLPNKIIIDGTDAGGPSEYRFEVTGEVEKSRSLGTVTAEDEIDGEEVRGLVNHGKDGYRYSGDVVRLRLSGDADVFFEDTDG